MNVIDTLVGQMGIVQRVIKRNFEGISDEESLTHPSPAGNSPNWVLGHIIATRSGLLKNLGEAPLLEDNAIQQYRRGSDGNVPSPVPLEALFDALDKSQSMLVAKLKTLPDTALSAKSPFGSPAGPDATLAEALAAMVFHESYHSGQLGLLRRVCGKKGAI